MTRRLVGVLCAVALFTAPSQSKADVSPLDRDWLLGFPLNTARFVGQPLAWDRDDWAKASVIVAGVAGLALLDRPIQDAAQGLRSGTTDAFADALRPFGNTGIAAAGALATYVIGEVTDTPRLERVGLDAFQALLISQGITQGVKFSVGRSRPKNSDEPFRFKPLSLKNKHNAFPSGHASASFAVATVIAEEYRDLPWVPWIAYGLAAGTGLSRINDDEHWGTDVAVGALLGFGVGKVVSLYSPFKPEDRITFMPVLSESVGFALVARF